jgi:hypothetical protein
MMDSPSESVTAILTAFGEVSAVILNRARMCSTAVVDRRKPCLTEVLDISNKIDTAEQDDPAKEWKN